ncbi:alpha/beta fold hydrolase [Sandarakinorhabdus glacialis]|nr:alpha/beta fold hydrolase [Polymorphobacter glacialis]
MLGVMAAREVVLADHASDDSIGGMAERLLAGAPARFDLVAHAMGGFVAFEVMRRAPERVGKLVLMSTLANADGPAQTARRQGYIDLVEAGRFKDVVEERIPILFPVGKRGDARLLGLARDMAAETGAEVFLRQQRAIMGRVDSRGSLGGIGVKTLVLWGDGDGIVSREQQGELLGGIAGSRLVVVPGAGHLTMVEEVGVVAGAVEGFLAA